jgi:hypothetical protein
MTSAPGVEVPASRPPTASAPADRRGSPIPTPALIATRFMELRKRRGLMIALFLVVVGIPTAFLGVRLILHAAAPATYGPAGGYDVYTALSGGVLYTFGFIVAAALGCTAGSVDLTDGMFRHLVVTGRSRVALYLARIPAGLAIIGPLVALGFSVVCVVCVVAAPPSLKVNGVSVPSGLSQSSLEDWAAAHPREVLCDLPYDNINLTIPCGSADESSGPGSTVRARRPSGTIPVASKAQMQAAARQVAQQNYSEYKSHFRVPSDSLMIKTGLWIELETAVGFLVGLGLGSLLGQRTVGVILMIVLEVVLTPIVLRVKVPHLENLARAVVGVATAHLEPGQLPLALGGGGHDYRLTESTITAVCVILAWIVGWTALGAWRMATRDA